MRQANAAEALVHHDRRDSAAHPDAQISIGRMLGLAAGSSGTSLPKLGNSRPKPWFCAVISTRRLHQVHDRLVATAVTELKLFHLGAAGQAGSSGDQGKYQRPAPCRSAAAPARMSPPRHPGVAGAVGQKDAIGIHLEHLLGGRIPRHDSKVAAGADQPPLQNAALDAAVVGDHFVTGRSGNRKRKVMRGRQVGGHKLVRRGGSLRSSPGSRLPAWGAAARRSASSSTSKISVEIMPILEPLSRRWRTRARVSTPSIATMPWARRYSGTLTAERQLEGVAHMSRNDHAAHSRRRSRGARRRRGRPTGRRSRRYRNCRSADRSWLRFGRHTPGRS